MLRALLLLGALAAAAQPASDDVPFHPADANASPRLARLRADVEARTRNAVAAFWAETQTATVPLVEPSPRGPRHSLVTFVWRGSDKTRNVVIVDGVAPGVGGVLPINSQMERLGTTDVWFRTYEIRNDARFTYKLSENDSMVSLIAPERRSTAVRDPLNPRVSAGFSFVELPGAPPLLPEKSDAPLAGTVETARFVNPATGNQHTASVYLPPGFRRDGSGYLLIVVLDGTPYTTTIPGPAILDALIARGVLRPLVAVFVDTSFDRAGQLSCSRSFSEMLATVIVPRIRESHHAGLAARDTAVAGSSLGGLASTCAAMTYPEVFGNVLSQSGSFWWTPDETPEWPTRQVTQTPPRSVRFYQEVGAMEIPQQLDTNRRFRDALRSNGVTVNYREFNGNHHYLAWRSGFADGLVSLFGTASR
jgi:enterochelin esterase family protein